ncbi:MAG: hypothetical protein ACYC9M_03560 [Desulfobulbaceae bacterium]
MEPSEILSIAFGVLAGAGLLLIQARKITNDELPLIGLETFKKASRINLDHYDKCLCGYQEFRSFFF